MIRNLWLMLFIALGLMVSLAGCQAPVTPTPQPNLPNPASVYCEKNGGQLDLRTAASGAVSGVCIFPDKSECDEWAYFRGECKPGDSLRTPAPASTPAANLPNPASVYCGDHGGKLQIVTATDGSQSGVCVFPNGSTCDEWAYFRGECAPAK